MSGGLDWRLSWTSISAFQEPGSRNDRGGSGSRAGRHIHPLSEDACLSLECDGAVFSSLHLLFETQYNELHVAADTIAERIRALGVSRLQATALSRDSPRSRKTTTTVPAAMTMVRNLVERARGAGAHAAFCLQDRRSRWRSGEHGHADRTHGGERQGGLDAAQPSGKTRRLKRPTAYGIRPCDCRKSMTRRSKRGRVFDTARVPGARQDLVLARLERDSRCADRR